MISIVSNLFRALAAYYESRAHDNRRKALDEIERLHNELEALRNSTSSAKDVAANTLVADRLRKRIEIERAYLKHLPDPNPKA